MDDMEEITESNQEVESKVYVDDTAMITYDENESTAYNNMADALVSFNTSVRRLKLKYDLTGSGVPVPFV